MPSSASSFPVAIMAIFGFCVTLTCVLPSAASKPRWWGFRRVPFVAAVSPFLMSSPFLAMLSFGAACVQTSSCPLRSRVFSSGTTVFAPLGMGCPVQICLACLGFTVSEFVSWRVMGLNWVAPVVSSALSA